MTPMRSPWRFWAQFLWPRVIGGCLLLLAAVVISLGIPFILGLVVDALLEHRTDVVPGLSALVLVFAVFQAGARIAGLRLLAAVARDSERALRERLFAHLIRLDAGFHREHAAGDIVSRLTNDLGAVTMMWQQGVTWMVGAGLLITLSSVAMFAIAPWLAVWTVLPMPLIAIAAQRLGRVVRSRATETQAALGALSASVQEDLAGINVVRSYHLEAQRADRFAAQSAELKKTRMAAQFVEGGFKPLVNAYVGASVFAVLWLGGTAAIDGRISVGSLVQFNAYLALLATRIIGFGDAMSMFQRGRAAWARLLVLFDNAPAITDGAGPSFTGDVRGELELRELTIEIEGKRLLDGISLRIPAGSTCAVVGRVGSGKSTLLEALPRLVDVPSGTVFIDGRDVTDLPLTALRGAVAFASQSPFLFSATIAENIKYGVDDSAASRDRVLQAADAAGLTPDLATLPSGLDTQVGERGITVSGGQRQRIALARTLGGAADRGIVVLDDALSSVDAETEHKILDNLERELAGKTLVLVSHRVAAVRRADLIAVLDEGKLVEQGTHDELLARGGVYADIYRTQAEETP
jgi:ATP-binding cassette subfamily B protein